MPVGLTSRVSDSNSSLRPLPTRTRAAVATRARGGLRWSLPLFVALAFTRELRCAEQRFLLRARLVNGIRPAPFLRQGNTCHRGTEKDKRNLFRGSSRVTADQNKQMKKQCRSAFIRANPRDPR